VRNIFDQYEQPENRLSHSLAVCLHEDRALLRAFLSWTKTAPPTRARALVVVEQSLPGDPPEMGEEEAERRGLPDIVIHDDSKWCLLVESKVMAPFSAAQIDRHERTLRGRGFDTVHRMLLTKHGRSVPNDVIARTWADLYSWLAGRRAWAERLRSYLRAAEARLVQREYLTEGTLTMFDGFAFSGDNPYTYLEARRLIKLAMKELRKERGLRALRMDAKSPGRGAITGKAGDSVWDLLQLRDRPKNGSFTRYPHLTLSVHRDHVEAAVTVPNDVVAPIRRRLAKLGPEGLSAMHARIIRRGRRILSRGASVKAYALQRHYVGQRSEGVRDARLDFALQTSLPGGGRVKHQPEWVTVLARLLQHKRSNMQFGYAFTLPWGTRGIDSRQSLALVVGCWIALKPVLDVVRGRVETP